MPSLNLYVITRDQVRPTRYYEYAENSQAACNQFRKYWNVQHQGITSTCIKRNVKKPLEVSGA